MPILLIPLPRGPDLLTLPLLPPSPCPRLPSYCPPHLSPTLVLPVLVSFLPTGICRKTLTFPPVYEAFVQLQSTFISDQKSGEAMEDTFCQNASPLGLNHHHHRIIQIQIWIRIIYRYIHTFVKLMLLLLLSLTYTPKRWGTLLIINRGVQEIFSVINPFVFIFFLKKKLICLVIEYTHFITNFIHLLYINSFSFPFFGSFGFYYFVVLAEKRIAAASTAAVSPFIFSQYPRCCIVGKKWQHPNSRPQPCSGQKHHGTQKHGSQT